MSAHKNDVRHGQRWVSKDPRDNGRTVRVISLVADSKGRWLCSNVLTGKRTLIEEKYLKTRWEKAAQKSGKREV